MKSYKDLIVWQKAVNLVVLVYKIAGALPETEKFGLSSQIKRSVISVPSNIAEGYGRKYILKTIYVFYKFPVVHFLSAKHR